MNDLNQYTCTGRLDVDPEFSEVLKRSVAAFNIMPPAEQAAMIAKQREGYARAEASWPTPQHQMINGVKVYASYEDYCNG